MRTRSTKSKQTDAPRPAYVKDVDNTAPKSEVVDTTAFGIELSVERDGRFWVVKQAHGRKSPKFDGIFTSRDMAIRAIEEYREERRA